MANLQGTATRTFLEPVLYTPEGVAEISINGIFRDAFVGVDVELEAEVATQQPTLDVRLSDLPQEPSALPHAKGDRLVVTRTGKRYRVIDSHPDGEGMVKLFLHDQETG